MITSNLAFYPCSHFEETEKFYTQVVGLKLVQKMQNVLIFSTVRGYFGFVDYGDKIVNTAQLCLSLNCESEEDVQREYIRILNNGGTPTNIPQRHLSQPVFSFFIKDPNGYTVEFQKLLDATL